MKLKSRENVVTWLRDNFNSVIAYHACRPVNLKTYLTNGIYPLDVNSTIKKAEELIKSLPYSVEYDFSELILSAKGDSDSLVYVVLDKNDFITLCPHYLIYGSEFLLSLVQQVNPSLKRKLKDIGIPTIIKCQIPLIEVSDRDLSDFFIRMECAEGTTKQKIHDLFCNFSIIIPSKINPEYIVGHEHVVEKLRDFHDACFYQNSINKCEYC